MLENARAEPDPEAWMKRLDSCWGREASGAVLGLILGSKLRVKSHLGIADSGNCEKLEG